VTIVPDRRKTLSWIAIRRELPHDVTETAVPVAEQIRDVRLPLSNEEVVLRTILCSDDPMMNHPLSSKETER